MLGVNTQRNIALQYALNGADMARATSFGDLSSKSKENVDNSGFYRNMEVSLLDGNPDIKVAKINVFASSTDSVPLASIKVTKPKINEFFYQDTGDNLDAAMSQKAVSDSIRAVQRNKAYEVGDIAYSNKLKSWMRLECVRAGTTGSDDSVFSGISSNGVYVEDGEVKWIVDDIRDGRHVGEVAFLPYVPAGYIKANGQLLEVSKYPRLVNLVKQYNLSVSDQSTYPGGFVVSGGNIRVPDYRGLFVRGLDDGKGYERNSRSVMSFQNGSIVPVSDDYGLGDFPISAGPAYKYGSDAFGASDFPFRGFTWLSLNGINDKVSGISHDIYSPGDIDKLVKGSDEYGYFYFYYSSGAPDWYSMVHPRNVALYPVMKY